MKNNSTIWILVGVGIILVGGFWFISTQSTTSTSDNNNAMMEETDQSDAITKDDSEENAIMEEPPLKEFTVTGTNFEFDVDEITVNEGDRVRVTFINGGGFHDWVLDEFNASTDQIQAGDSQTIEFIASQAGEYEYYCSVGSHREQGMVGTLIVN